MFIPKISHKGVWVDHRYLKHHGLCKCLMIVLFCDSSNISKTVLDSLMAQLTTQTMSPLLWTSAPVGLPGVKGNNWEAWTNKSFSTFDGHII